MSPQRRNTGSGSQSAAVRAELTSPGEWGWYGNSAEHQRYMQPAPSRSRRRCDDCEGRPRPRATHVGMANGVALMSGCEWHVRQWVRSVTQGVAL